MADKLHRLFFMTGALSTLVWLQLAASELVTGENQAPTLSSGLEPRMAMRLGESVFNKLWVSSPSSTKSSDGLGPLYNARSCAGCHPKAGKGSFFLHRGESGPNALIARLAGPHGDSSAEGDPVYGRQLQERSVAGVSAEGRIVTQSESFIIRLADQSVQLHRPRFSLSGLAYGELSRPQAISYRNAPALHGVGLLDEIPLAQILAREDADDADGDGISGRANWIDGVNTDNRQLGRFGWKAGAVSLAQQNLSALRNDLGLSAVLSQSPWGDCTLQQTGCVQSYHGNLDANLPEVEAAQYEVLDYYVRKLLPKRSLKASDASALAQGEQVFRQLGCEACHRAEFTRSDGTRIYPYTDLLLHNMGPGLADQYQEHSAQGNEWRTAPLWGIGSAKSANRHAGFLHDGRAATLLEAILWHGGESEHSRDQFISLPRDEREALISFLESL